MGPGDIIQKWQSGEPVPVSSVAFVPHKHNYNAFWVHSPELFLVLEISDEFRNGVKLLRLENQQVVYTTIHYLSQMKLVCEAEIG